MLDKEITEILLYVGVAPEKKGFYYLKLVLMQMYQRNYTLKEAYRIIMRAQNVNSCTIDSSIRNVIHSAYECGKIARINEKIGMEIIDNEFCPTNKAFIYCLIHCLGKHDISKQA